MMRNETCMLRLFVSFPVFLLSRLNLQSCPVIPMHLVHSVANPALASLSKSLSPPLMNGCGYGGCGVCSDYSIDLKADWARLSAS
jgi:hypothetical protein